MLFSCCRKYQTISLIVLLGIFNVVDIRIGFAEEFENADSERVCKFDNLLMNLLNKSWFNQIPAYLSTTPLKRIVLGEFVALEIISTVLF